MHWKRSLADDELCVVKRRVSAEGDKGALQRVSPNVGLADRKEPPGDFAAKPTTSSSRFMKEVASTLKRRRPSTTYFRRASLRNTKSRHPQSGVTPSNVYEVAAARQASM